MIFFSVLWPRIVTVLWIIKRVAKQKTGRKENLSEWYACSLLFTNRNLRNK